MHRLSLKTFVVGLSIPLALALASSPALAHGTHVAPIQGTVTDVSSSTLQVLTQTGSVSMGMTAKTHVTRIVTGSTADLHANQRVEAHLVSGTSTIDAIVIDQADNAPASRPVHTGTKPTHTKPAKTTHPSGTHTTHTHQGPTNRVDGVIVSVNGNVVTLKNRQNASQKYTFNNSVTITKSMKGAIGDLQIGQTVKAARDQAGNAVQVTILNT